jgi:hypothetical protein
MSDWCMRQLGWPVIEVNVDEDQVDDAIDDAFSYMYEFNSDGIEPTYLKHQVTSGDVSNTYIQVSDAIVGVTRIFPVTGSIAHNNMFDLRYQMRLHDLWDFTSTSYVNYVLTQQHIRTLDMIFTGEQPIRFNRHTNKLHIDWAWGQDIQVGEYVIIEGYVIIDPATYPRFYNDRLLKKLATAKIKKMWASNLKKYSGMKLPSGITLDGVSLYIEAVAEETAAEQEIRNTYEKPPAFIIG